MAYDEITNRYQLAPNVPVTINAAGAEKFQLTVRKPNGRDVFVGVDGATPTRLIEKITPVTDFQRQIVVSANSNCSLQVVLFRPQRTQSDANQSGFGACIRAAIRAYKLGMRTRPVIISGIGDSNFTAEGAGDGTGTVPKLTNAFEYGPIMRIPDTCPTLAGLPVRTTAWWGDGNAVNNGTPFMEYNPRVTLGTDWARTTGVNGALFGSFAQGNPNSAGYFSYNFGSAFDTVEIYAVVNGTNSNSVGIYNSNNVLVTSINTNGTSAAAKFTVTGNFADGIIKLKNNGANNCYIAGMIAWNSAEKAIILMKNSFSGSAVANYSVSTNVWDGMGFWPQIQADLAIVSLTINDITAGTTRANYNTGLTNVLDYVAKYGDGIVSTGGNGTNTNYTNGSYQGIEAEAKKVAGQFGMSFISMHKEWESWTASNALGYEYDGNHRSRTGYAAQAEIYGKRLLSILGT